MTEVVLSKSAALAERLTKGELLALDAMLKALNPEQVSAVVERIPLPAVITDQDRKALRRLPEVFGSVVPTERRQLTPEEVEKLLEERDVIDAIVKLVTTRKENITITVHNHFDAEVDQDGGEKPLVAEKGYYIKGGAVYCTTAGKKFAREVSSGAPSLSADALKALSEDPDSGFSKEDYLACTSQVRQVDEAKLTLHLRKNPRLLAAIERALTPGKQTASINVRKI